jgi:pyruvate/2-oxoglutarate dehydrogenase complex dihydrolipoamide acyltransferase (E2) component
MHDWTRLSGWRKIAGALWSEPRDPQIYGLLELDASGLLAFIARARAAGSHVTPTHLVGRALAHALTVVPELNVRLVGCRVVPRGSVDVFFITAVERGHDLSGIKIVDVANTHVFEVARQLSERSTELKRGHDPTLARAKALMTRLPRPLLRWALRTAAWATGEHAWSLPGLGVDAAPFGSAMVSSVGMFGLPIGFAPLVWLYRVPLLVLVAEIQEKPVAIAGRVEVRPVLPLTCTVDHRYTDGAQLGRALTAFRAYLADPSAHEPALLPRGNGTAHSMQLT